MADGCVKIKLIRPHRISRGRAATCTFTLLRGVSRHAERADLLRVLSRLVPLIEGGFPVECRFGGETYAVESIDSRMDHGRRCERARFAGECEIFREHGRRRRKIRRAEKRSRESALRAKRRERAARIMERFRRRTPGARAGVPVCAAARAEVHASPALDAAPALLAASRGSPGRRV